MPERTYLPPQKCPFAADNCAAYNYHGQCDGVVDIEYTSDKPCPFYKHIDQNYDEHCGAISRLLRLHRFDLLDKYHKKELFD